MLNNISVLGGFKPFFRTICIHGQYKMEIALPVRAIFTPTILYVTLISWAPSNVIRTMGLFKTDLWIYRKLCFTLCRHHQGRVPVMLPAKLEKFNFPGASWSCTHRWSICFYGLENLWMLLSIDLPHRFFKAMWHLKCPGVLTQNFFKWRKCSLNLWKNYFKNSN